MPSSHTEPIATAASTVDEPTSSPEISGTSTGLTTPSPTTNEFFDDVFGSPPRPSTLVTSESDILPSSPSRRDASLATTLRAAVDGEDGVASTDNLTASSVSSSARQDATTLRESSDVARLRSTHTRAGYREGLSAAKDASLQPGFDEGYIFGAALGVAAGTLVGILEALAAGVSDAVAASGGEHPLQSKIGTNGISSTTYVQVKAGEQYQEQQQRELANKLQTLAQQCRAELDRSSLQADEYIDMEGLWKWEVNGNGNEISTAVEVEQGSRQGSREEGEAGGVEESGLGPERGLGLGADASATTATATASATATTATTATTAATLSNSTPSSVSIHQVAAAHPLIRKWRHITDHYCRLLGGVSSARLEQIWVDDTRVDERVDGESGDTGSVRTGAGDDTGDDDNENRRFGVDQVDGNAGEQQQQRRPLKNTNLEVTDSATAAETPTSRTITPSGKAKAKAAAAKAKADAKKPKGQDQILDF